MADPEHVGKQGCGGRADTDKDAGQDGSYHTSPRAVSLVRQDEADQIIDLMHELGLTSLLPRGTKVTKGLIRAP